MIHFQNTPFKDFVVRIFKNNVLSRPSLFFSPLSLKFNNEIDCSVVARWDNCFLRHFCNFFRLVILALFVYSWNACHRKKPDITIQKKW